MKQPRWWSLATQRTLRIQYVPTVNTVQLFSAGGQQDWVLQPPQYIACHAVALMLRTMYFFPGF